MNNLQKQEISSPKPKQTSHSVIVFPGGISLLLQNKLETKQQLFGSSL